MNYTQWNALKAHIAGETPARLPVALIVDSPWIPGFVGCNHTDYFADPAVFLDANLQVIRRFPDVTFLPGFWVEMGMGAEPSGFGCRMEFYDDRTPLVHPLFDTDAEAFEAANAAAAQLPEPDPRRDGLMPLILAQYRRLEPRVKDAGGCIKMVAARGPLAIASHLMGVTNFLLGLKLDPDNTHRLLRITTNLARRWLEAQAEVLSEVEGVMLLDDLVGFLSRPNYLEFAHPYLQEIYAAFPGALKALHNDMTNSVSFPYLADLGVQLFNPTHQIPFDETRRLVGESVCLMGGISPLETLRQGTPADVRQAAEVCHTAHPSRRGLILSVGGGTSPGTPAENVDALVQAAGLWD